MRTQTTAVLGIALTYCGVNMLVYISSIIPVWRYRRFEAAPDKDGEQP